MSMETGRPELPILELGPQPPHLDAYDTEEAAAETAATRHDVRYLDARGQEWRYERTTGRFEFAGSDPAAAEAAMTEALEAFEAQFDGSPLAKLEAPRAARASLTPAELAAAVLVTKEEAADVLTGRPRDPSVPLCNFLCKNYNVCCRGSVAADTNAY